MALPTSDNTVNVTRLGSILSTLWGKIKTKFGTKADKVSNATNGNLASLDSNGNLTDSGKTLTVTSSSVSDGTTTFNKYTHPTSAGYRHIPSGGSAGQVLVYGGSSGTASWGDCGVEYDVNFTIVDNEITCDTDVLDILAAKTAGKIVKGVFENRVYYLTAIDTDNQDCTDVRFISTDLYSDNRICILHGFDDGSGAEWENKTCDIGIMRGASSINPGKTGTVPVPAIGEQNYFLKGDGTWGPVSASTALSASWTDFYLNEDTPIYGWHIGSTVVNSDYANSKMSAVICLSEWTESPQLHRANEYYGFIEIYHRMNGTVDDSNEVYFGRIRSLTTYKVNSDNLVDLGYVVVGIRGASSYSIDWYVTYHPNNTYKGIYNNYISLFDMYSMNFTKDLSLTHLSSYPSTYLNWWGTVTYPFLTPTAPGQGKRFNPVYVTENGEVGPTNIYSGYEDLEVTNALHFTLPATTNYGSIKFLSSVNGYALEYTVTCVTVNGVFTANPVVIENHHYRTVDNSKIKVAYSASGTDLYVYFNGGNVKRIRWIAQLQNANALKCEKVTQSSIPSTMTSTYAYDITRPRIGSTFNWTATSDQTQYGLMATIYCELGTGNYVALGGSYIFQEYGVSTHGTWEVRIHTNNYSVSLAYLDGVNKSNGFNIVVVSGTMDSGSSYTGYIKIYGKLVKLPYSGLAITVDQAVDGRGLSQSIYVEMNESVASNASIGTFTECTTRYVPYASGISIGSETKPVYMNSNGQITACTSVNADTVDGFHFSTSTSGSATNTVYLV